MTAAEVLQQLRARGLDVALAGGRISITGLRSKASNLWRDAFMNRDEIADLLCQEDPRPDLADSALWSDLLRRAYALDGDEPEGLFGALHGLRCCGARLEATATSYRLRPDGDAWEDEKAWEADTARWLEPHRPALVELLRSLRAEVSA